MGVPAEGLSTIDFEGGISSLDIEVPAQVGCIIYVESALSSLSSQVLPSKLMGVIKVIITPILQKGLK